jgi:hypothetical protein
MGVESAIPGAGAFGSAPGNLAKVRRDSQGSPSKIEFSPYLDDIATEL